MINILHVCDSKQLVVFYYKKKERKVFSRKKM